MQCQTSRGPILLLDIFEKVLCLCLVSLLDSKTNITRLQNKIPYFKFLQYLWFPSWSYQMLNEIILNHFNTGSHFFGTHILIPENRELQSQTFKYRKKRSRNMAKTWLDIEGVWPLSTRGECKNMIKDHMQRWSWNLKSKEPMLRNSRGGNDPWLGALTICIKYDLRSQVSQLKIQIWGKGVSFHGDKNLSYFHAKMNHDNNA